MSELVKPISAITSRAMFGALNTDFVVISPPTMQRPVETNVSHATRDIGSSFKQASRMASEIWSDILSGCPSVTDSDVKICLNPSAATDYRFPLDYLSGQ